jgi:hypothetical protein
MQAALKVRRARRDDFARVQAFLGGDEAASRAERKRFRRLVSTMREDLYVVEREDEHTLDGLAVIVYARGLGPPTAIVRTLRGSAEARRLLLDCARARAVASGCTQLEVLCASPSESNDATADDVGAAPWSAGPRIFRRAVTA